MAIVNANTWAGRITARPVGGYDADLAEIQAAGFTVLGSDFHAGESFVWVHGTYLAMDGWINDFERKFRLPGFFIPLGFSHLGEEITLVLVKQWVSDGQIAF